MLVFGGFSSPLTPDDDLAVYGQAELSAWHLNTLSHVLDNLALTVADAVRWCRGFVPDLAVSLPPPAPDPAQRLLSPSSGPMEPESISTQQPQSADAEAAMPRKKTHTRRRPKPYWDALTKALAYLDKNQVDQSPTWPGIAKNGSA
jgi:hypothetical protein